MANFKDMTGYVFNGCKVLERHGTDKRRATWKCICFCGKEFVNIGSNIRTGHVKSCGCLRGKTTKKRNTKHNKSRTRIYHIWSGMKSRCNNPKNPVFNRYGGRGITICDEWEKSFENFWKWAEENGYSEELTIDRINNDGNYEPSNCRWANYSLQGRNKRNNVLSEYRGKMRTRSEISELTGLSYGTIRRREESGIDYDAPLMRKKKNKCS